MKDYTRIHKWHVRKPSRWPAYSQINEKMPKA